MANVVTLNERLNALHDRIDALYRQRDVLDVVAMTPRELRQVKRLGLRAGLLELDAEELREQLEAAYAKMDTAV